MRQKNRMVDEKRIWLRGLSLVVYLTLTYLSSIGHAQYLTGPVAGALGGAGRAASDDGEQVLLNPAAVVHASVFSSSLTVDEGLLAERERLSRWTLSLIDNSENLVLSGGYTFAQSKKSFDVQADRDENYHQFAVGSFIAPHFSWGGAITYLTSEVKGENDYEQWDLNLGLLYNPYPEFAVGLVGYNLLARDRAIPIEVQNQDRVALGLHYIAMPMFRLRLDVLEQVIHNPDRKKHWQFGIESKVGEFFFTRFGAEKDQLQDRDYLTLGLGFDGPKMKMDYAYRNNSGDAMHSVDLRMSVW